MSQGNSVGYPRSDVGRFTDRRVCISTEDLLDAVLLEDME